MDFKIQPSLHPYQVNTANETTEEERRRQRPQDPPKPADKKMTAQPAQNPEPSKEAQSSEPGQSQIIDSKTTIELLSHVPVNSKSLHERLKKLTNSHHKENLVSDVKHVNKTL